MHLKIILQKQVFSEIRVCIVQDSRFGDYKKASLSSLKLDLDISYTKSVLSFFMAQQEMPIQMMSFFGNSEKAPERFL